MLVIRKGFEYLFLTSVMGILTPNEVEYRVCGPNTIDVDVLKKISSYSSCSETDEYIVRFWKAIEGFTEHEKRLYLKFVWGRSRLPPEDHLKECRHTVMLHSAGHYPDHDIQFPEAHTCFFQIDLPRYTKDQIARDKILYAIEACGDIDGDNWGNRVLDDDVDLRGGRHF